MDDSSITKETSVYGQTNIKPFSGAGLTPKKDYQKWVEELDIVLVTKLDRWRRIITGTQTMVVTDDNVELIVDESYKDLLKAGRTKDALSLWNNDHFWTKEEQQRRVDHDKEQVFGFLCTITERTARNQIRTLGPSNIHDMWTMFQTDYGITLNTDIRERERIFEAGITNKAGTTMEEREDMAVHIHRLEAMQQELRDLLPASEQLTNKYCQKEMLQQILCDSVHPLYLECIQTLRHEMWMNSTLALSADERALELAKGCKAYEEFPVPFDSLRDRLIQRFKRHQKLWKGGRRAVPNASGVYSFGNDSRDRRRICWDCGQDDHLRNDSACESKGSGKFEPEWLKAKKAKAGRGDKRSHDEGGGNTTTFGKKGPCHHWTRGHCQAGPRCEWSHDHKRGNNRGKVGKNKTGISARLSQSRRDRAKNLSTIMVAALTDERSKDDDKSTDEDANSDYKKQMTTLVTQSMQTAGLWMMTTVGAAVNDNRYGKSDCYDATQTVLLSCGAMSAHAIAMDNCAKCSASNQEMDFLFLDRSKAACESITLVGIGGTACCGGRGPLLVTIMHSDTDGTWCVIDPDGIFIGGTSESCLRILAANKLEQGGLVIQKIPFAKGRPAMEGESASPFQTHLFDSRTGTTVPLVNHDGLQMLQTVNRSAKNYKKNKFLNAVVPLITDLKHSPLVHLNRVEQSYHVAASAKPFGVDGYMPVASSNGTTVGKYYDTVDEIYANVSKKCGERYRDVKDLSEGGSSQNNSKPEDFAPIAGNDLYSMTVGAWLTGVDSGAITGPGSDVRSGTGNPVSMIDSIPFKGLGEGMGIEDAFANAPMQHNTNMNEPRVLVDSCATEHSTMDGQFAQLFQSGLITKSKSDDVTPLTSFDTAFDKGVSIALQCYTKENDKAEKDEPRRLRREKRQKKISDAIQVDKIPVDDKMEDFPNGAI